MSKRRHHRRKFRRNEGIVDFLPYILAGGGILAAYFFIIKPMASGIKTLPSPAAAPTRSSTTQQVISAIGPTVSNIVRDLTSGASQPSSPGPSAFTL